MLYFDVVCASAQYKRKNKGWGKALSAVAWPKGQLRRRSSIRIWAPRSAAVSHRRAEHGCWPDAWVRSARGVPAQKKAFIAGGGDQHILFITTFFPGLAATGTRSRRRLLFARQQFAHPRRVTASSARRSLQSLWGKETLLVLSEGTRRARQVHIDPPGSICTCLALGLTPKTLDLGAFDLVS